MPYEFEKEKDNNTWVFIVLGIIAIVFLGIIILGDSSSEKDVSEKEDLVKKENNSLLKYAYSTFSEEEKKQFCVGYNTFGATESYTLFKEGYMEEGGATDYMPSKNEFKSFMDNKCVL